MSELTPRLATGFEQSNLTKTVTYLRCLRCDAEWVPRVQNPKRCPNCQSTKWYIPRGQLKVGRPKGKQYQTSLQRLKEKLRRS